jgi:hypothetical protein
VGGQRIQVWKNVALADQTGQPAHGAGGQRQASIGVVAHQYFTLRQAVSGRLARENLRELRNLDALMSPVMRERIPKWSNNGVSCGYTFLGQDI